jgi:hypothetical protein
MLQQSLPLNSTIANLADLCAAWREEGDLTVIKMSPAMVIFDVLKLMGVPDKLLPQVLTHEELEAIGDSDWKNRNKPAIAVKCQFCQEEAEGMVRIRGAWYLVCDNHQHKLRAR